MCHDNKRPLTVVIVEEQLFCSLALIIVQLLILEPQEPSVPNALHLKPVELIRAVRTASHKHRNVIEPVPAVLLCVQNVLCDRINNESADHRIVLDVAALPIGTWPHIVITANHNERDRVLPKHLLALRIMSAFVIMNAMITKHNHHIIDCRIQIHAHHPDLRIVLKVKTAMLIAGYKHTTHQLHILLSRYLSDTSLIALSIASAQPRQSVQFLLCLFAPIIMRLTVFGSNWLML